MILLEAENAIINEAVKENKKNLDTNFSDFSGCKGWLRAENNGKMKLSLKLPAWEAVSKRPDILAVLKEEFNTESGEEGWDVTVESNDKANLASLRSAIMGAPLKAAINAQKQSTSFKPCTVKLSSSGHESFTVACVADQMVCLFATHFADATDTVLARVFLQEMFDVRKTAGTKLDDAPTVLFGPKPPADLSSLLPDNSKNTQELSYISIVLFPRHFNNARVLQVLPMLRDYLHYHLKCCKAYLHGRMRAKTADFLKILNRAKPENF